MKVFCKKPVPAANPADPYGLLGIGCPAGQKRQYIVYDCASGKVVRVALPDSSQLGPAVDQLQTDVALLQAAVGAAEAQILSLEGSVDALNLRKCSELIYAGRGVVNVVGDSSGLFSDPFLTLPGAGTFGPRAYVRETYTIEPRWVTDGVDTGLGATITVTIGGTTLVVAAPIDVGLGEIYYCDAKATLTPYQSGTDVIVRLDAWFVMSQSGITTLPSGSTFSRSAQATIPAATINTLAWSIEADFGGILPITGTASVPLFNVTRTRFTGI